MPQAVGTFETEWDERVHDEEEGVSRFSATVSKVFRGDLDGTASLQVLRTVGQVRTSAGYVAMERVNATLHGRSGTFVLQHNGTMSGGKFALSVVMVPDSGTGELKGLAGEMVIVNADGKHSYAFDYTLAD
ncbi:MULTISPECIES: DUF3224 domain-containing protein [unclassified Streptomyces]|uniref:DUF3224 domain-containing protein n=1 Tax=unclassified Streptomyces TaxID=2593676 RepID=UPI002E2A5423|nr:DUF3224 domain-containing protein [Streptomyces sp. NBC_00441]